MNRVCGQVLRSRLIGMWLFDGGGEGEERAHGYERDFSRIFCKFVSPVSVVRSPHCSRIKRLTPRE